MIFHHVFPGGCAEFIGALKRIPRISPEAACRFSGSHAGPIWYKGGATHGIGHGHLEDFAFEVEMLTTYAWTAVRQVRFAGQRQGSASVGVARVTRGNSC